MEEKVKAEIIQEIKKTMSIAASCSISEVAASIHVGAISLREQKSVAKALVRSNPFKTELKNGQIYVQHNLAFTGHGGTTEHDFKLLKQILGLIAALLAFLLFNVFLPKL